MPGLVLVLPFILFNPISPSVRKRESLETTSLPRTASHLSELIQSSSELQSFPTEHPSLLLWH